MIYLRSFLLTALIFVCVTSQALAAQPFEDWLADLRKEAARKGISDKIIEAALTDIEPKARILELDRKQPEGTLTFEQYQKRVINQARINKGRELYRKHRKELDAIGEKYGVPGNVIVALWGIETSYGDVTGGFNVVEALATLAYDGRRSKFFRDELFKALKILDEGHISPQNMKGSWAGAMGQNQFMPSSFFNFAVDGNDDGRRDIWTSLPDVFASTANYLHQSGWKSDERWGRRVQIPSGFDGKLSGRDIKKPLKDWRDMGVTLPNGKPIAVVAKMRGSIILPDGIGGPAFLVYDNYNVIMKWNRSIYFATSVGLLSDAILQ
jgi:membrane-bound lytic murein transglycosylase B